MQGLRDALPPAETDLLGAVVAAKLGWLAPQLHRWYDDAALGTHLRDELAVEVRRVFDDALAAGFMTHCPVPGATVGDFKNRWLALPGVGRALVGIRFKGLDPDRPFVDVVVTTRALETTAQFRGLVEALGRRFAVFAPRHVRVFVPSHLALELAPFVGRAEWEQRYLAAPIADMLRLPRPAGYERVTLAAPPSLDFYPRYVAAHEEVYALRPAHREYARPEARDDLAAYVDDGTLFEVFVDGRWAGVVAGGRAVEQGMRGFIVAEIVLTGTFRGRGLGAAVQRHFAEVLPHHTGDVLMGTIHSRNAAAVATAKRCGRADIGGYLWLRAAWDEAPPVADAPTTGADAGVR